VHIVNKVYIQKFHCYYKKFLLSMLIVCNLVISHLSENKFDICFGSILRIVV